MHYSQEELLSLKDFYLDHLMNDTIPFWFPRSYDETHGGYLFMRDADGSLIDDDKAVWIQGRGTWMLSTIYNTIDKDDKWREGARFGYEFLNKYCFDTDGQMFFHMTRDGQPLRKRRYFFSETFYVIAAAAYSKATGCKHAAENARRIFGECLAYAKGEKKLAPKYTGVRPARGIGVPMIMMNTAQQLRETIGDDRCDEHIMNWINEIEKYFVKDDISCVMEQVAMDGSIIDHIDGRTLNPGHAIEGAWFILHEAMYRNNDQRLIDLGCRMIDYMWERGWDKEYGGILYFRDVYDKPVQEYWQDMKFWWPHNETIIATLLAYIITGNEKYANWHRMVHQWSYEHFHDKENGEWYGYLHRDGTVAQTAKGNLYKGPFHLPRQEWYCYKILEKFLDKKSFMKYRLLIACMFSCLAVFAQLKLPVFDQSGFSTYYHQRYEHFKLMPVRDKAIIFAGNSITDGGEWSEMFNDNKILNRGISGDHSAGLLNRADEIIQRKPAKIFVLIGVNDLARNISVDSIYRNILMFTRYTQDRSPSTKLFIQSILPVNKKFGLFKGHTSKQNEIAQLNDLLSIAASKEGFTFVDLFPSFADKDGNLLEDLTNDGLHLTGAGYSLWKHLIYPYVYDLNVRASIIPQPQQIEYLPGRFPLYACRNIIADEFFKKEAQYLSSSIKEMGWAVTVNDRGVHKFRIELKKMAMSSNGSYQVDVSDSLVLLQAADAKGIFYAIQTLLLLGRDGIMIDACKILDRPAFAWRGYMVDVGRNYQSIKLLKQQIDQMSRYKLNVLQFHATEDIAWRFESSLFPQLTAPDNMLRNKGMYYTKAEIRELIKYAKDRHILFVPEIDMPGHSAAFKRAMKTDMQSDTGIAIIKKLLKEFCDDYDVPFIHIGGDEVKIINKQFMPEITAYLRSLGKEVIGWEPGANYDDKTIRQLWMEDGGRSTSNQNLKYIDSRHLYINHMDPLESVVTIFNRAIGKKQKGDDAALGGTLCLWHDRAVAKEEDMMLMNAVYPSMITFGERSWRGGGKEKWIANISDGDTAVFELFERRLLDHKKQYFEQMAFPYLRQSNLNWTLTGPGNKKIIVKGGTIVLKHWWYPLIEGAVKDPKENTTWIAETSIWSDEDRLHPFWIGFNNISRSPATDSNPVGAWDPKGSEVWVNDVRVDPPNWIRGGQAGHPEIPLTDEKYESRPPAMIQLKKGWNRVRIKVPVQTFKGKDWQNPVKWMFTFVPVSN